MQDTESITLKCVRSLRFRFQVTEFIPKKLVNLSAVNRIAYRIRLIE